MKYYMIDTIPACMDDDFNIQAWNPETRKVEPAMQFLTYLTLGMDANYEPVDVEEVNKAQYDGAIKAFGG
jgi:hypothetical protein